MQGKNEKQKVRFYQYRKKKLSSNTRNSKKNDESFVQMINVITQKKATERMLIPEVKAEKQR